MCMKLLGRILFGFMVIVIGYYVFGISYQSRYNEFLVKEGSPAMSAEPKDYQFFRGFFENYRTEDVLSLEGETHGDYTYNLHAFIQSEGYYNRFTILLDGITNFEGRTLSFKITTTNGSKEDSIFKLSKDNWYLNWVFLDQLYDNQAYRFEDVLDLEIFIPATKDKEKIIVYDYDETQGPLVKASEADILSVVKGINKVNHDILKFVPLAEAGATEKSTFVEGEEKTYNVSFNTVVPKDLDASSSVYVVGSFNDWTVSDHYKLTRADNGAFYSKDIEIKSKTEDIEYQFVIGSDASSVEVDKDGNMVFHKHKLVDKENLVLADHGISSVEPYKFSKYNYIIWRNVLIYLVVVALITWLVFFRKKRQPKARYTPGGVKKDTTPKQAPQPPQQNLNLKAITDIEERDEDLNVVKPTIKEDEVITDATADVESVTEETTLVDDAEDLEVKE